MKRLELKGRRFGVLVVLSFVGNDKRGKPTWEVKCDCGTVRIVYETGLFFGRTHRCDCIRVKAVTVHGMSRTHFYRVFVDIGGRCNNSKNKRYKDYGGRGVKCLWKSFEEFRDDMHESYLEHKKRVKNMKVRNNTTIERINTNGNYCKENCRWATQKEQGRNRRNNRLITYKNETKTLIEWAEKYNLSFSVLYGRLEIGWPIEKALTTLVLNNIKK